MKRFEKEKMSKKKTHLIYSAVKLLRSWNWKKTRSHPDFNNAPTTSCWGALLDFLPPENRYLFTQVKNTKTRSTLGSQFLFVRKPQRKNCVVRRIMFSSKSKTSATMLVCIDPPPMPPCPHHDIMSLTPPPPHDIMSLPPPHHDIMCLTHNVQNI